MVQIVSSDDLVAQIDEIGVAETVKAHRKPPLPTRILRDLYELYHDQDRYLEFLAHYPLIPSDLADEIINSLTEDKPAIAIGLAANPRCPQQGLNKLTSHPDVAVRTELARNVNLTPKEFQVMVADENDLVRSALTENPSLPNPLQFILADDASSAVRIALAGRKNLDLDVALHLGQSEDTMVSAALILQWKQDEELLQFWADIGNERAQLLLLKRSMPTSSSIQKSLRFSTSGLVHRSALKMSPLSAAEMLFLAESVDTRDRSFLATCTDLPSPIQRILAKDPSPKVRRHLASNATINQQIALHIAASSDLGACRSLAKNPAISDELISELCIHPEDEIALLVTYRDDLINDHLNLLINHRRSTVAAEHLAYQEIEYSDITIEISSKLASSPSPSTRAFVAQSKNLNKEDELKLVNDPFDNVRLVIVNNSTISEETLKALTHDANQEIVLIAESRLNHRLRSTQIKTTEENLDTPRQTTEKPKKLILNKIINFFAD